MNVWIFGRPHYDAVIARLGRIEEIIKARLQWETQMAIADLDVAAASLNAEADKAAAAVTANTPAAPAP